MPAITQYSPGEGRSQSRGRSCRLLCCRDPPGDGKVTRRTEDGTGIGQLEFRRVKLNVSWNPGKLNTLLVKLYDYWTIGLFDSKIFRLLIFGIKDSLNPGLIDIRIFGL